MLNTRKKPWNQGKDIGQKIGYARLESKEYSPHSLCRTKAPLRPHLPTSMRMASRHWRLPRKLNFNVYTDKRSQMIAI
jgi:hypothetical protein